MSRAGADHLPEGAASAVAFLSLRATDAACACPADQGLQDVSAEHQGAASKLFESKTGTTVEATCVCEVKQLTVSDPAALTACKQEFNFPVLDSNGQPVNGYCYVDEEDSTSNPEVVSRCSSGQKRAIRFVGRPAMRGGGERLMYLIVTTECGSLAE